MRPLFAIFCALVLGTVIASCIGCSAPITNGEIVSKKFVPEHQIEVDDPDIQVSYDPPLTIPGGSHMETVPDKWYITFGKKDEDDEYKERTVRVDQTTHDQCVVGEWFNLE